MNKSFWLIIYVILKLTSNTGNLIKNNNRKNPTDTPHRNFQQPESQLGDNQHLYSLFRILRRLDFFTKSKSKKKVYVPKLYYTPKLLYIKQQMEVKHTPKHYNTGILHDKVYLPVHHPFTPSLTKSFANVSYSLVKSTPHIQHTNFSRMLSTILVTNLKFYQELDSDKMKNGYPNSNNFMSQIIDIYCYTFP